MQYPHACCVDVEDDVTGSAGAAEQECSPGI